MSAQCSEVGCSLGDSLIEELEGQLLGISCSEVKLEEDVFEDSCSHLQYNIQNQIDLSSTYRTTFDTFVSIRSITVDIDQNFIVYCMTEAYLNEIRLLRQYIAALEKQVESQKQQLKETAKIGQTSLKDTMRLSDQLSSVKQENKLLKVRNLQLTQSLKRFTGLEQQYLQLRSYLDQQGLTINQQQKQLEEVILKNHTLYNRIQDMEKEKVELSQEMQSDKIKLDQIIKEHSSLQHLLGEEQRSSAARISILETNHNSIIKAKNQQISNLNKKLSEIKLQTQSQIKQLNSQKVLQAQSIKTLSAKLIQVNKQNQRLENTTQSLNSALTQTTVHINTLSKEHEEYIARANKQKQNLFTIIKSLKAEKANLEALHSTSQGSSQQISRSLANSMKQIEHLKLRLHAVEQQADSIKHSKSECDKLIISLKKQLEQSYSLVSKAQKQREEALQRENEVIRSKMHGDLFYNQEINNKQEQICALRQELQSNRQENQASIRELQEQLKALRVKHLSEQSHLASYEIGLKSIKVKYQQQKEQYQTQLKAKQLQLKQMTQANQKLKAQLKEIQKILLLHKQKAQLQENSLKEQIKNLQRQKYSYIDELNKATLSSLSTNQDSNLMQTKIEGLTQALTALEKHLQQHKASIQLLTESINQKQKQVQTLQESNAALRRQLINTIKNEENSQKQLVQLKSKVISITSKSRIRSSMVEMSKSSIMQNPSDYIRNQRRETTNSVRSGSSDKHYFNKKRMPIPINSFTSMVAQTSPTYEESQEGEQRSNRLIE